MTATMTTAPTMEPIAAEDAATDSGYAWKYVKRYYNPDTGHVWQVVTEYWPEDAPEAAVGDPCPFAPGLVAVQRTVILSWGPDDFSTTIFSPVVPL